MIITCNNCNKNFEIDPSVIPEKGRLLQCSGCDHKWFFKKEIIKEQILTDKVNVPNEELGPFNNELEPQKNEIKSFDDEKKPITNKSIETIELLDPIAKDSIVVEKISIKDKEEINTKIKIFKNKKNYNILGLIIVFIISFIALIVFLDTFQKPISNIIPNIEFLLYSLYETINDIGLFFKDLI